MRREFLDNLSSFIRRFHKESEHLKDVPHFETLMQGLSDGTVDFKWNFGGRLLPHQEPLKKPNMIWLRWFLSAPIIYPMIIPIVFLDISVSIYQWVCFWLWEVPHVKRSNYIVIDRHRLSYLKTFQKLNCIYCGYANGVIAYARMVAAETERYWCPVKHEDQVPTPHDFYVEFLDYNDIEGWHNRHSTGISDWGNGSADFR